MCSAPGHTDANVTAEDLWNPTSSKLLWHLIARRYETWSRPSYPLKCHWWQRRLEFKFHKMSQVLQILLLAVVGQSIVSCHNWLQGRGLAASIQRFGGRYWDILSCGLETGVFKRSTLSQSCCNCVDSTRELLVAATNHYREQKEITHTLRQLKRNHLNISL